MNYNIQLFRGGVRTSNSAPADVVSFSDPTTAYEYLQSREYVISEPTFDVWSEIVTAKRTKAWTKEQKKIYEVRKSTPACWRPAVGPDGEPATRGNAIGCWMLVIDCDGARVHPGALPQEISNKYGGTARILNTASDLQKPGHFGARILWFFDRVLSPQELAEVFAAVQRLKWSESCAIDPTSAQHNRLWYLPTRHKDVPRYDYERSRPAKASCADEVLAVIRAEVAREEPPQLKVVRRVASMRVEQPIQAADVDDITLALRGAMYSGALQYLDAGERSEWLMAGMALKEAGAQAGDPELWFSMWEAWSRDAWGDRPLQRPYREEWATFRTSADRRAA